MAYPAILLLLCMLVLLMTPTTSAVSQMPASGNSSSREENRIRSDINRGMVTDIDGIIGNGQRGADRASEYSSDREPAVLPEDNSGVPGSADSNIIPRTETGPSANSRTVDGETDMAGSNSAIGWIIAIIIVLAAALVVLALLPKRDREDKGR